MTIHWDQRVSLSWMEGGKVRGRSMAIGEAVDLFATFSNDKKSRAEIFLLKPIEIAPDEEILRQDLIEKLLELR
jgi:hypothetical protein